MSLITRIRKQKAVLWVQTGSDDYGHPSFANAVEIDCRWQDGETEVIAPSGEKKLARSTVFADRSIALGSFLRLGSMSALVSAYPAFSNSVKPAVYGAHEVISFSDIPNLKTTETLHKIFL